MPAARSTERATLDLFVGLDFGTAATKVVIRAPFLPHAPATAVDFGSLAHQSSPYLLPSRLRVCSNGRLSLSGDDAGEWLSDLKLPLMDRRESAEPAEEVERLKGAVAYLGLVLREARARFLAAERETYSRFEPRWSLYLGIPSAGYDDTKIRARFVRVARAAWSLSQSDTPLTSFAVVQILSKDDEALATSAREIEVIPEVIAQAVGYARSTFRDPGLHLLIDVGAGTLDVCSFILHEAEGRDHYSLLTTSVDQLGVLELHRQRVAALQCPSVTSDASEDSSDPLIPLKESLAEYHPGCACGAVDIDERFVGTATGRVMEHLLDLRRHRDPLSRRWETGLPVFLCGGGSEMGVFRTVPRVADRRLRSATGVRGLLVRRLPRPAQLRNSDIDERLFHRISVAYGLSLGSLDIGDVWPPSASPDIPPPRKRDAGDGYISKDQV